MRSASAVALFFMLALSACGHFIGDGCNSNVDCSPAGDRFCDLSQVGGYCTVEGCDVNTCPDQEPCVRFFTVIRTEPCTYDPATPGRCNPTMPGAQCCRVDERCVPDAPITATPDGGTPMLQPGHCAPESTERRWCVHHCANDGDCRDANYGCFSTSPQPPRSTNPVLPGALPVPTIADPTGANNAANFCVQRQ